ncbi:MAG: hypothetical protein ACTHK7_08280 [Aureliella sp.]
MILRRGITSFFNRRDREAIPEFPFIEFKRVVYGLAAPLCLAVSEMKARGVTPNFHSARLVGTETSILILGHSNYPIFAFSQPLERNGSQLRFVDSPHLAAALTRLFPDLIIAPAEELNRRATESDLDVLGAVELEQIKYWKPRSVGEIAFNWWD